MPAARSIRIWGWVHTWSSLVCTLFLLYLCVTGLPLIFHHEIEDATRSYEVPVPAAGTPRASYDRVVESARSRHPELFVQFVFVDDEEPELVHVSFGATPQAQEGNKRVVVDARTAKVLAEPDPESGVMYVLFKLHVDMFAGLPGKLFLGAMGLLFVVAVVSGVVVYAPYMRRLDFATVRTRTRRLRWLDLHNVLGIVTVAWVLVVGLTGVINTWADLAIKLWQVDQLAAMTAPYAGKPPLTRAEQGSLERAIETAQVAMPDLRFSFVAYPGTLFSSPHHYAVYMRGTTPLTSRLLKPALIDAQAGTLTDSRELPWYIMAILVSQPLHFGDYGGLPLKILWALLDLITIVVLASGIYLWLVKRRREEIEGIDLADRPMAGR
ncbi:MAG TPA: PepSY domain-containing protein [Steroidobacteraceae bacterium]|nr:PepSY domain-containing protein [Steroidobacteraceae bacterium]